MVPPKRPKSSTSEDEVDDSPSAKRLNTASNSTSVTIPASSGAVNGPAMAAAPATIPTSSGAAIDPAASKFAIITPETPAFNRQTSVTIEIPLGVLKDIQDSVEADTDANTSFATNRVVMAIRAAPKAMSIRYIGKSHGNLIVQADWTFEKVLEEIKRVSPDYKVQSRTLSFGGTRVDLRRTVGELISKDGHKVYLVNEGFWET